MAAILRISKRAVRDIEKRALIKLRAHPVLRRLWREIAAHRLGINESMQFTRAEVVALLRLARDFTERNAVKAVLRIVDSGSE